ncbi:WXG100 family type VII secretion target [Brachybacterium sp. NPDC056505]|uniref:WXG100 family type VII secretion target n=1 Tax=Brachybacterium sp. NPDC056505 TaxID=3345843 RepID=UPI00366C79E9
MNSFFGMDVDSARAHAQKLDASAQSVLSTMDALDELINSIVGSAWSGPDADDFRETWASRVLGSGHAAGERLRQLRGNLLDQADDQERASGAEASDGGLEPFGPTTTPPIAPPSAGPISAAANASFLGIDFGDISWGEFGSNLLERIGISPEDWTGGIVSGTHSFAKRFGEHAIGKVPGFVPVIGDVFTGLLAGVDRWNQDEGRDDLSIPERLGRAGVDGIANGFGSFVGGALGSGLLGLLGVGGGAVAGAETGPGAVVTGGAGGVVGLIAGDLIGGYVGATVADAAVDTFLD